MCGIVAIVRRQSTRAVPSAAQVLTLVNAAAAAFDADSVTSLDGCRASLQELNSLLLGVPGAVALLESPGLSAEIAAQLDPLMKTLTTDCRRCGCQRRDHCRGPQCRPPSDQGCVVGGTP